MSLSQFSSTTEGLGLSAVEAFHDRLAAAVQLVADRLGYSRANESAEFEARIRAYERRMVRTRIR